MARRPRGTNLNKFGSSFQLTDLINGSKFGIDWSGSFGSGEVQICPFPSRASAVALQW